MGIPPHPNLVTKRFVLPNLVFSMGPPVNRSPNAWGSVLRLGHSRENGNPGSAPAKTGIGLSIPAGVYPARGCGAGMTRRKMLIIFPLNFSVKRMNDKGVFSGKSPGLSLFLLLVLLFLKKGLKIDDLILFRPLLLFLPGRDLP